jgi:hypothetical protein
MRLFEAILWFYILKVDYFGKENRAFYWGAIVLLENIKFKIMVSNFYRKILIGQKSLGLHIMSRIATNQFFFCIFKNEYFVKQNWPKEIDWKFDIKRIEKYYLRIDYLGKDNWLFSSGGRVPSQYIWFKVKDWGFQMKKFKKKQYSIAPYIRYGIVRKNLFMLYSEDEVFWIRKLTILLWNRFRNPDIDDPTVMLF